MLSKRKILIIQSGNKPIEAKFKTGTINIFNPIRISNKLLLKLISPKSIRENFLKYLEQDFEVESFEKTISRILTWKEIDLRRNWPKKTWPWSKAEGNLAKAKLKKKIARISPQ